MLQKVTPEQGIPHFRNVHLSNLTGIVRDAAISISGMKESPIEDYFLTDIDVEARSPGKISFAKGWRFINVTIRNSDAGELKVRNSTDMEIELSSKMK